MKNILLLCVLATANVSLFSLVIYQFLHPLPADCFALIAVVAAWSGQTVAEGSPSCPDYSPASP